MESESILIDNDDSTSWLEKKLARITLSWFLTGLTVILLLVAWNRGIALLYGLVALIIAILVVAWFSPRINLIGVTAKRSIPKTAFEGNKVKLQLELTHTGLLNRYLIEVWDCLPFTDNHSQQLLSFTPVLLKRHTLPISIHCDLRGVHKLGPLVLKSGFPLGINRREVEIPNSQNSLLVYPQPLNVQRFDLGMFRSSHADNMHVHQRSKGHDEFAGVREYRHGDTMRHIHWPASARRNELIVKEFHPVTTPQLSILLNLKTGTNIGKGKHSTLEYAVKIAVSLGHYALTQGIPFSLAANNQHLLSPQNYKHPSQREELLNTLACVQADSDLDYQQLIHHFVAQENRAGSVILFDNGEIDLDDSLNMLLAKHYQPIVYRFDIATFELQRFHTAFIRSHERGTTVFTIQCGTDLARLFE